MTQATDNSRWFRPAGAASRDGFDVAIAPDAADWKHTGLFTLTLRPGETRTVNTGHWEYLVVPLQGGVHLEITDAAGTPHLLDLAGRLDVFTGPTDVAYVPKGATVTLSTTAASRIALAVSTAAKRPDPLPVRYLPARDVPVEIRGAGSATRQVRNFGTPGTIEADSLIACEVITPAGNWSSYPPHKHDEEREGVETSLEEIYYFEIARAAGAPQSADAFGYQRVYGTDERPIDVLAEVSSGDVVLVPHGWHGPAMAPPGYDMYYLNVMAGPGATRAWLICDDPAHAWVRSTWESQHPDPRLVAAAPD